MAMYISAVVHVVLSVWGFYTYILSLVDIYQKALLDCLNSARPASAEICNPMAVLENPFVDSPYASSTAVKWGVRILPPWFLMINVSEVLC